ncbi:MAG: hypothetical protein COA97_03300 [Flavobacteriales bacterium]|nr:MAG: hypothetical protein COA97_03300 [Flavobacteriales bacterium]
MKILGQEFDISIKGVISLIAKNKLFVGLIILFAAIKYGLFNLNYDKYHIIVTLATFAGYLTVLVYGASFLIKKKKILLVNFTVLFILLFVVEIVCYFYLGMPKKEWKDYSTANPSDHIGYHLGHVPWADSVWHDVKINGNDTVFDTYYDVDSINRRRTPGYDENKKKYAIFFGCSICFGKGLKDNQTIPYYTQENTETYNSYNYSFNGWGCHHMLARLEHKDLSKEVKEKDGIGIYIFIWPHIRRAIGDMRIYTGWGHTMPYYYLDDGEVIRDGNFASGRWFTSRLYEYLNRSFIWDCFKVNLPTQIQESHMVLAAEIIKKSKETYEEQFGNDNFYVVIHPVDWEEFTPERNEQFKLLLKQKGIKYLDYSQKLSLDEKHIIKGDGHPNEISDEKCAKMLVKDLGLE